MCGVTFNADADSFDYRISYLATRPSLRRPCSPFFFSSSIVNVNSDHSL